MDTDLLSRKLDDNGFSFNYNGIDLFSVDINNTKISIKDDVTGYEIISRYGHNIAHSETEVIDILKILKR
ncbi:hypothetical protein QAC99_13530 [Staphylococcus aureus]|nr:hypothetical protein [Staphylococcus aureus]